MRAAPRPARLSLAAALSLLAACAPSGGFDLPQPGSGERPQLTLVPSPVEAFAGERVEVELRMTGDSSVAPAEAAALFLNGAPVKPEVLAGDRVAFTMPLIEGACLRAVALTAAVPWADVAPATLAYRGAGHPRDGTVRERGVRFVPRLLRAFGDDEVLVAAYGQLLLTLDAATLAPSATNRLDDFLVGLDSVDVAVGVKQLQAVAVYAGQFGTLGRIVGKPREVVESGTYGGGDPLATFPAGEPPAPAAANLPSVLFDAATTVDVAEASAAGDASAPGAHSRGLLLRPSRPPAFYDLGARAELSEAPLASALAGAAAARRLSLVGFPGGHIVVSDGLRPSAALLKGDGTALEKVASEAAADFPLRVAAVGVGHGGYNAALVSFARDPSGSLDSGDAFSPLPASVATFTAAADQVVEFALNKTDVAWASPLFTHSPAVRSLAGRTVSSSTRSALFVAAVDGLDPVVLSVFRDGLPGAAVRQSVLPLFAPGAEVTVLRDDSSGNAGAAAVVSDVEGRLYRFALQGAATPVAVSRIPTGVGPSLSVSGDGCGDSAALVPATSLDGMALLTASGSLPVAFLPAAEKARAVAEVTVDAGGSPRTFYVSGGSSLVVSQPVVQRQSLSLGAKPSETASTSPVNALAVVGNGTAAPVVVAGGPGGLLSLPLEPESLFTTKPTARPVGPGCSGAVRLVAVGGVVYGLGVNKDQQVLCRLSVAEGQLVESTLPPGVRIVDLAASRRTRADGTEGVRLFVAGVTAAGALYLGTMLDVDFATASLEPLEITGKAEALLPTSGSPTALGVSPDGAELYVGIAGTQPGILTLAADLFLPGSGATDDARAAGLRSTRLGGAPLAFAPTADGRRLFVALEGDALAIVE